eukprot:XP_019920943.1 PREDICTED: uncharacterized protein LOC105324680 [Crassostrea gigas]
MINDALRTFDEAQAECRVNGGNLARIPNSETYEILTKEFENNYWIGVNDKAMEGVYVDMENTKQTFLPWTSNEPNNKEIFNPANCLVVVSTGVIFGARCNVKFSTFCANNNETLYLDKNVTFNDGLKNCEAMKSGEVRVAGPDQITEDTLKRYLKSFNESEQDGEMFAWVYMKENDITGKRSVFVNADCVEKGSSKGWLDRWCTSTKHALCSKRLYCYRNELLLRFDNNTTTLLNMSRISDEVAVNTSVGLKCKSQHRLVSGDLNVTCTSYAGWTGNFPICRRCKCPCDRVKNQVIIHDTKELELKIADLKKDLEIKKSTVLSSQLRKRTSANDDRVSAKTVGAILGPLLIAMILGLIVISDIPILLSHLRRGPFAAVEKKEKKVTKKNHKNMTADACA